MLAVHEHAVVRIEVGADERHALAQHEVADGCVVGSGEVQKCDAVGVERGDVVARLLAEVDDRTDAVVARQRFDRIAREAAADGQLVGDPAQIEHPATG